MKLLALLPLFLVAGLMRGPAYEDADGFSNASYENALTADVQRFAFRDDHDERILAEATLRPVRGDGRLGVEMTISAVGASVEPILGFEGVRGGNRFTAEQFAHLLSGMFPLHVQTTGGTSREIRLGQVRAGRSGYVPERRLESDGRINFLARSRRAYPLELIIESGALSPGEYETDVVVGGAARLRVRYRLAPQTLEVLSFAGLPDPRLSRTAPAAAAQPVLKDPRKGKEEKPLPPPVADADWDARDLEAKWLLFRKSPAPFAAWRQYLVKHADHAFLEWIALYGESGEQQMQAAWALARAEAPQWLRVAAWLREADRSGHNEAETQVLLVKHAPAVAFAWLDKHRDHYAARRGAVYQDYLELAKQKLPRAEVRALPPLEPAEVFRHLAPPKDLADLGARLKADAAKVYVHQVQRAVKGLVNSGRYENPWLGQLRLLTHHRHPDVRQSAYLAYTYVAPSLDARPQLLDEFFDVVNDAGEPASLREAALMAFSYFWHPRVVVALHHIASQPEHPAWRAAVSRLGDLGNDFTIAHLGQLAAAKLSPTERELLASVRTSLTRWAQERRPDAWSGLARSWLEQAAWAEHVGDILSKPLRATAIKLLSVEGDSRLVTELERLQQTYEPGFPIPGAEQEFANRVRALARAILSARVKKS